MANKGPYNAKVTSVSQDDLAKVFSGKITNWKELGGESAPIVVINRAAGSGTRTVFGKVVLGGDKFVESQTEDNSGALVAKLKQTKGAISYLALSFKDDELATLSLKGEGGLVEPTTENITAGKYPIWAYEHMYTKGEATGGTKAFIDYVVSPEFQNDVLPTVKGFISVTAMKTSRDAD
jgi:phosphate transport system substrate-binding protein